MAEVTMSLASELLLLFLFLALSAIGGGGLQGLTTAVGWIASWILWVLMGVFVLVVGTVVDFFYNRKKRRGEAPYRLPFAYRLSGWRVGYQQDSGWKNSFHYDRRSNRIVPITRPLD